MARVRDAGAPLPPSKWPVIVLGFSRGASEDPVTQAALSAAFHQWRADRDEWRAEHCPDLTGSEFLAMANAEHRRRARIRARQVGPNVLSAGPRPATHHF